MKQAMKKGAGLATTKKTFSEFKKNNGFGCNIADKPIEWLIMPEGFQSALRIPGLAQGYVHIVCGHSHTGKSTLINHAIVAAQKVNVIPVIYDTENNFDFTYAKSMGFQAEPVYGEVQVEHIDHETGEVTYTTENRIVNWDGDFLYFNSVALAERYGGWDYSTGKENKEKKRKIPVIEDIAKSINELLKLQEDGEIQQGLFFVWDSVGSIGGYKSYKSDVGNNMFDAGSITAAFNTIVNTSIPCSRKVTSPYTNTFLCVNKVWNDSSVNPVGPPSLALKGGKSLFYGAHGLVILCGGQLTAATKKLFATSKGANYNYAIESKLKCIKNQLPEPFTVTYEGKVVCTPHGYICPEKLDEYKKKYIPDILKRLNEEMSKNGSSGQVSENDITFTEEDSIEG